jgi:hypothetical protein
VAAVKVNLLGAGTRTTWVKDGREIALKEPEGKASDAQLAMLNKAGALAIVKPGQVEMISKGEASAALDVTKSA